jgi:DNA-dependent RNA polymerase auxiliary subunit epsilon
MYAVKENVIVEKNDDKLMYYLNILEQIENFLLLEENKYIFLNDAVDYSTDEDSSTSTVMCYFSVKDKYYNKEFLNKLETEFYQYLQDNNMLLIEKSSVYVTTIDSPTKPNEVVISITDEYMLFNESMGVSTSVENIAANIYDVVKTKMN